MEQYKLEGQQDTPANPVKVSAETKHIQSVESKLKQLQENFNIQQQEIAKLHRDISRLKSDISDLVTVIRNRG